MPLAESRAPHSRTTNGQKSLKACEEIARQVQGESQSEGEVALEAGTEAPDTQVARAKAAFGQAVEGENRGEETGEEKVGISQIGPLVEARRETCRKEETAKEGLEETFGEDCLEETFGEDFKPRGGKDFAQVDFVVCQECAAQARRNYNQNCGEGANESERQRGQDGGGGSGRGQAVPG